MDEDNTLSCLNELKNLDLPVTDVLDELGRTIADCPSAVLRAPPGAGKTTCVPLFLINAGWLNKRKILMLAPRRLAARAAARRMAHMLGENVGQTIGFRVRADTQVGPTTRVEVITDGVLIRMLQSDPSLRGVGLVIFDEFHERRLAMDLGLALCLDIQGILNTNLKLLVMSATMATTPVADVLGGAPVIDARGHTYPIETRYIGTHTPEKDMKGVTRAVRSAIQNEKGNILVFLPGEAEIRRLAKNLHKIGLGPQWKVLTLLGNLSPQAQDHAIAPPPQGCRKIVLATAIAETSLTIEGIGVVVDSGLQRISRFDVRSGMSRLVTLPVSQASADQRRGRAGRLGPGVCLRMWSEAMNEGLIPDRRPEIMETDLCGLALALAEWGISHPGDLKWLDPPPQATYDTACHLLQKLKALDQHHRITRHGREMANMPVHPRLAHMMLMARTIGQFRSACDLAALLMERDPIRFESGQREVDVQLRFDLLQARRRDIPFNHPMMRINEGACRHILSVAAQLHPEASQKNGRDDRHTLSLGRLLAWAYPDRIAHRRPGIPGRYRLTGGQGVRLNSDDPLSAEAFIVVAEADGKRHDAKIFRAAAYSLDLLEEQYGDQMKWRAKVHWDSERQSVSTRRTLEIGTLTLREAPLQHPDEAQLLAAMLDGIEQSGLAVLPWTKTLRIWQARVNFLHKIYADDNQWPNLSDTALVKNLTNWLAPFLQSVTSLRALSRIDLRGALYTQLPYERHQQLDNLAPTHWTVPSGSRIPIDYNRQVPVLAVRIQEMFGLAQTPVIAEGRQRLLIHLLSPAGRPVQVTQDLAGFWKNSYYDIKKDLKGRYPKHFWPDDPLHATATAKTKPRKTGKKG